MRFFIVSKYLHPEARRTLKQYGEILEFFSDGPPYFPICNHPDIFICQIEQSLVVAPNTPAYFLRLLEQSRIPFVVGEKSAGHKYPFTCHYNVVVSDTCIIHCLQHTEPKILSLVSGKEKIHVRQGYTRCNCIALRGEHFLCSDRGIFKVLQNKKYKVLYVESSPVQLEGMKHGFIGGCMGKDNDRVYVHGTLNMHPQGNSIKNFFKTAGYQVIELYDGYLKDVGSIFVIDIN